MFCANISNFERLRKEYSDIEWSKLEIEDLVAELSKAWAGKNIARRNLLWPPVAMAVHWGQKGAGWGAADSPHRLQHPIGELQFLSVKLE